MLLEGHDSCQQRSPLDPLVLWRLVLSGVAIIANTDSCFIALASSFVTARLYHPPNHALRYAGFRHLQSAPRDHQDTSTKRMLHRDGKYALQDKFGPSETQRREAAISTHRFRNFSSLLLKVGKPLPRLLSCKPAVASSLLGITPPVGITEHRQLERVLVW
jgi:hypothetical protein